MTAPSQATASTLLREHIERKRRRRKRREAMLAHRARQARYGIAVS